MSVYVLVSSLLSACAEEPHCQDRSEQAEERVLNVIEFCQLMLLGVILIYQ